MAPKRKSSASSSSTTTTTTTPTTTATSSAKEKGIELPKKRQRVDGKEFKLMDQYFTQPPIVTRCLDAIEQYVKPLKEFKQIIEPSAGSGAFFDRLPETTTAAATCVGIELDAAQGSPYVKMDFLELDPHALDLTLETQEGRQVNLKHDPKNTLIVGNPPFGKVNKLALAFLNRAFDFADTVAFVLPKVFRKPFFQNRIRLDAHLVYEEEHGKIAYDHGDEEHRLFTVFQIWQKRDMQPVRTKVVHRTSHPDFVFLPQTMESADVAGVIIMTRVGTLCGRIISQLPLGAHTENFFFILPNEGKEAIFRERLLIAETHRSIHYCGDQYDPGTKNITKHQVIEFYADETL